MTGLGKTARTHALGRYLAAGAASMSRSIPADRFDETARALRRHLAPGDRPRPRAGGTAHLGTDLTPEVSWHVCRPDGYNEAGFQLAVNGTVLWQREAPAWHRVYVHGTLQ